ncbi:unnamed protein product [Hymenolepis diminuta]|uniref:Uncharacterized protein n=1 Tax=Hymenolepis diminuta TaxID=6216 RepID=A0A564XYE8_HYMDI|nr:unnamed protein product [Hymenolepis diminuta]
MSETPLKGTLLRRQKENPQITNKWPRDLQPKAENISPKANQNDHSFDPPGNSFKTTATNTAETPNLDQNYKIQLSSQLPYLKRMYSSSDESGFNESMSSVSMKNRNRSNVSGNNSITVEIPIASVQTRPISSPETHLSNSKLRDRLYEFLENDISDISTASIIKNKTKRKSKSKRTVKNDSSETETIREDKTLRKPTQIIKEKDDTSPSEETLTIINNECSEKMVHLKPVKPEESSVSKIREQQERAALRLIPSLAPISTSKLSLLDEFRLLHLQITSIDSQNLNTQSETHQSPLDATNSDFSSSFDEKLDKDSSITIRRYNAFDPLCASISEPDHQHKNMGLMCTSKMTLTPGPTNSQSTIENAHPFYDSYAPYLRDLASTVGRCCSVCETEVSDSTTSIANQGTKEEVVKEIEPAEVESFIEAGSDCDNCMEAVTDADSDLLCSVYSVVAHS